VKTLLALVIFVTACSDGTKKTPDAAPVLFTGEYVDWDSSDTSFCGIFNASFQSREHPGVMDMSNPNGRFMLNIPLGTKPGLVDITPSTTGSECLAGMPTYALPGVAVADPAVIATGQIISLRNFTAATATMLSITPDPAKGHVFVHVDGSPSAVAISTGSGLSLKYDGTSWTAGTTGVNVFFANVDPGMTDVTMGTATGNGTVPVEAGKITYVTLVGS
jgi:hypothetical protein